METCIHSERIYEGSVVNVRRDQVQLLDGRQGTRMVIEHPGGVVVLPVLPDGRLLFIEQFRYALNKTIIELPAGKLEPGEDPDEAVRRELMEETGYAARQWQKVSYIYTAPGFCDEALWLYFAEDLYPVEKTSFDEEEDIELLPLTQAEAWEKVLSGEITDAKTIALLALWGKLR